MSITEKGTAVVVTENRFVPSAYDGDCCSEPVATPTVEGVLKSGFDFKPGYLGFKFTMATQATIQLADGKELTFKQERSENKKFYFADEVVSAELFLTKPCYQDDVASMNPYYKTMLMERPDTLICINNNKGNRSVKIMPQGELADVSFITREGAPVVPRKMVLGIEC